MQDSMMTLASLAIQAGPNEYWKVVCVSGRKPAPVLIGQSDDTLDQVSAPVP
jgi:hypothetical protein